MRKKPIIGNVATAKNPVVKSAVSDKINWSFSFRYFNQINYFGLAGMDSKWFVSLLERLKELCYLDINGFFSHHVTRDAYRYHPIDWKAKNIPIRRDEIDWVEKEIIENEEDYPFFQFQISKGLGRVVGFWDEDYKYFNIVLLDPKHNLQPSKKENYRVDNTSIEHCEFISLLMDLDNVKGIECVAEGCNCKSRLNELPTKLNRGRFVYFQIDEEYYETFLRKTENMSLKEIIELGLIRD